MSLAALLEQIPDPRRKQGLRHPLPAVLALMAAATAAGHHTLTGIGDWGRALEESEAQKLGFTRCPPCTATLSNILKQLDAGGFQVVLDAVANAIKPPEPEGSTLPPEPPHLAIDGKRLRGSGNDTQTQEHFVSLYRTQDDVILAQAPLMETNEHKRGLDLLEHVPLQGTMVTGDAMFTQRDVVDLISSKGGGYVLPVEENQPNLRTSLFGYFSMTDESFSPSAASRTG